jgi:hypothetical protein
MFGLADGTMIAGTRRLARDATDLGTVDCPPVEATPSGGHVLLRCDGGKARIWSSAAGKAKDVPPPPDWERVRIAEGGAHLVTWSGRIAAIRNVVTGREVARIESSLSALGRVSVSEGLSHAFGSGAIDSVQRLEGGKTKAEVHLLSAAYSHPEVYEITDSDRVDLPDAWVVYNRDGLFDASARGGSELVAAVYGSRAYPIDHPEIALAYNRPDRLLESMGLGSPELRRAMARAHSRRQKKAGKSPDDVAGLAADLPSLTVISQSLSSGKMQLEIRAQGDGTELARLRVFVNDVPVFGRHGKSIAGSEYSGEVAVPLVRGANKVEIDVVDARGRRSLREALRANWGAEALERDLYFVGIGVSDYRDRTLRLGFPSKDVADLAEVFRSMKGESGDGLALRNVKVLSLTDEKATRQALDRAREFLKSARREDFVVLFAAGHGVHADVGGEQEYFFLTHEADTGKLSKTSLPYSAFESLVDDLESQHKLLVLDTCESGEWYEPLTQDQRELAGARGLLARGARGLELESSTKTGRVAPRSTRASEYFSQKSIGNSNCVF